MISGVCRTGTAPRCGRSAGVASVWRACACTWAAFLRIDEGGDRGRRQSHARLGDFEHGPRAELRGRPQGCGGTTQPLAPTAGGVPDYAVLSLALSQFASAFVQLGRPQEAFPLLARSRELRRQHRVRAQLASPSVLSSAACYLLALENKSLDPRERAGLLHHARKACDEATRHRRRVHDHSAPDAMRLRGMLEWQRGNVRAARQASARACDLADGWERGMCWHRRATRSVAASTAVTISNRLSGCTWPPAHWPGSRRRVEPLRKWVRRVSGSRRRADPAPSGCGWIQTASAAGVATLQRQLLARRQQRPRCDAATPMPVRPRRSCPVLGRTVAVSRPLPNETLWWRDDHKVSNGNHAVQ